MKILLFSFCVLMQVISASASLISLYEFNGNFSDSFSNNVDLVEYNNASSIFNAGSWTWTATANPGGGLIMDLNAPRASLYSIGLRLKFDLTSSGYRKIIDFKNQTADDGLYFYNDSLSFYPITVGGMVSNNTFLDLVITRDGSSVVSVYANGNSNPLFTFADSDNRAVAVTNSLARFHLFHDDNTTAGEWSPGGTVSEIRVWNHVLAPSEIPGAFGTELTILRVFNSIFISWPSSFKGFTLEENTNLSLTNSWVAVPQNYVTNQAQIFVQIPIGPGNKFFRLRK
ncbi:MAG: hypothetical protein M3Y82_07210 [Verrucomicrobiota bacterium]|nr:hypothetical protein [Verrucomicrobiota bacterium]